MDKFDLYEDLELEHEKEKKESIEDLRWKEKYTVALNTIEKLQAEKKELNRKIKQLEINFASLLETARTEIKRKDTQISELRKQKDDICFRRFKPKIAEMQSHEYSNDSRATSSGEKVKANPFSCERKQADQKNNEPIVSHEKPPHKERLENGKHHYEKSKNREQDSRSATDEKVGNSRKRSRDRSRDRNRDRDRSRNRNEYRSRHRSSDRRDHKHRDRFDSRKRERSKERHSRRDERSEDQHSRRHERNNSESRSSEGSWQKSNKTCYNTQQNSKEPSRRNTNEVKPKDTSCSSKEHSIHRIKDTKTDDSAIKSDPLVTKKPDQKIEILQIEILKDVKELKKSKLEAEKLPKPPPSDPMKVQTEKSNQFLDALFDDSLMNQAGESNSDLYDDLLEKEQNDDTKTAEKREHSSLKIDENCNLNFETPKRQPVSMDDLFGPSPVGSLCSVVGVKSQNAAVGSPNDVDFIAIEEPQKEKRTHDSDTSHDCQLIDKDECPSSFKSGTELHTHGNCSVTDSNFRCQLQTPQKQVMAKVYDDLFGPSPANSNCGQTISIDKPSNDTYFEPISINGEQEEQTLETAPILIDNSSSEESTESQKLDIQAKDEDNNLPDAKSFKFVELDSSFYSSEDDANDGASKNQLKSSSQLVGDVVELSESQSKNNKNLETKDIANAKSETDRFSCDFTSKSGKMLFKIQTEKEEPHKSSPEEDQNQIQNPPNSSSSHRRSDRYSKKESGKFSSKISKNHRTPHHNTSPKTESDEKQSSCHRHAKEKHHHNRDSLSSHIATKSPKRHSKTHHRHKAKRNRKDSKTDSFKERTSSLQSEDDRHKVKPAEQDQVFFLHCEELSDDNEILDSSVSIEIQEHDLVANDKISAEEDKIQETNVTDCQTTNLIPNQTLQNEIDVERVEDTIMHSESQPSPEKEVESECIVASESEKCKYEETNESVHQDQEEIECNTNARGRTTEEGCLNSETELDNRELSENNFVENKLAGPKNEGEKPVEQNIFRGKQNAVEVLVNSKEHEILDTQQPGSQENEQLAIENSNSNENSQQEQRIDTEKVDISTKKEEDGPSNLHNELNEENNPNMPEKHLADHIKGHLLRTDDEEINTCVSKSGEDNRRENDYVNDVRKNDKPFCEEKLETEISSRNSSKHNLTVTETTNGQGQRHIEQAQESKSTSEKLEVPNATSFIENTVKTQSYNEPAKIESTIHSSLYSSNLISSPMKISRSSVDDNENSAHSSTESNTSGRRRKIKTPRKRTDDFIQTKSPSINVKLDSNSKPDVSPSCMPSEMNTIPSNSLSEVLKNGQEVAESIKSGEQSFTVNDSHYSETETHTKTSIKDLDSVGKARKGDSNYGDADESGIPQCQGKAEDSNYSSQLAENSLQQKEDEALLTIAEPTQSPRSEEKSAFLNKVKLTENKPNKDAEENKNTNVIENLVDQGENPVIVSRTESGETEIDQTKLIDSNTSQGEASSGANDSRNKIIEFKQDDIQKIVETFSISITRKRIKKKPIKEVIEPLNVISNEVGFENPKKEVTTDRLNDEPNKQDIKINPPHIYDDEPCCSSSLNVKLLNGSKYPSKKTKQKSRQPQMMKHFMDSEHILVGECNYQSVSFSEQSVDTNSNEIKPNNRKRKSKADSSLNTTQSSSPDKLKRKYKRKTPQFLESSLSNDDNGHKSIDANVENLSLKEPPKVKRKYTKRKSKQSEWLEEPTSSLSKLDLNNQRDSDKVSETVQTSICSQPEPERLNEITSDTESLSHKKIRQSSPKVKSNNQPKRQRKRKLSDEESKNVSIVSESKKSKTGCLEISPVVCDTKSFGSSVVGTDHPHKSPNTRNKSTGVEKSTASVELTPTHHKIFLNDVFPNEPPLVYKANDDDHQYHEIDDRLRCMFQSPSYTQSSNGEYSLDKTNDDHVDVTCDSQHLTFNETILSQSEPTKLSDLSSSSTKKLSLGSNEYVIEPIGSHSANVFITRNKCKKRTKVVAGAM